MARKSKRLESGTGPVACYVRVSTNGQNSESQKLAIEGWLKGQGIPATDVRWYQDQVSGSTLDRPAFDQLQADIFAGQVRTVVVFKLDRLSRSLKDGVAVLTGWLESGVRVVSVTQQLDFNGATGKLIASVLFAVAEMEMETRRERQAYGIQAAKQRGVYMGRRSGTAKFPAERIIALRKQGLSHAEIAQAVGCTTKTVQRALARPDVGCATRP